MKRFCVKNEVLIHLNFFLFIHIYIVGGKLVKSQLSQLVSIFRPFSRKFCECEQVHKMIKNLDLNFSLSRDLIEALCLWQVKLNFLIIALMWPLHFLLREKHCFVEVILARKKPPGH